MDGILAVDKPQGMTSHDIVAFIRKHFGFKKVGHAGTLDPIATGLLVILIGRYTRSSNLFINDDKEYVATLVLGARSDTGDAWGKVIPSGKEIIFTNDRIEGTFKRFLGEIYQTPPAYSAIKYKGRKLYELARKNISVEIKPRKIHIKELEIMKLALPEITFRVRCSKGTYVRQLCADIGDSLGCGGYMSGLRRTRSGKFSLDEALSMEELKKIEAVALERKLVT